MTNKTTRKLELQRLRSEILRKADSRYDYQFIKLINILLEEEEDDE